MMLANYDNTEYFNFENQTKPCRIVDVYDGDTITVIFEVFQNQSYKFRIRLAGIDTPEIRGGTAVTKDLGLNAKNRVISLITGHQYGGGGGRPEVRDLLNTFVYTATLKCGKFEKYGRLLAEVYLPNMEKSINTILLEEGLAKIY